MIFDIFFRTSPDRKPTGSFSPQFSESLSCHRPHSHSSHSTFRSRFPLSSYLSSFSLSLFLSFLKACLRSTKMRSCPPTTPSRRTASCVDLVAVPFVRHLLSLPAVGEKEGKNEGREAQFHGLLLGVAVLPMLGGGFEFLAGFLIVILAIRKINLVSSPVITYPPLQSSSLSLFL